VEVPINASLESSGDGESYLRGVGLGATLPVPPTNAASNSDARRTPMGKTAPSLGMPDHALSRTIPAHRPVVASTVRHRTPTEQERDALLAEITACNKRVADLRGEAMALLGDDQATFDRLKEFYAAQSRLDDDAFMSIVATGTVVQGDVAEAIDAARIDDVEAATADLNEDQIAAANKILLLLFFEEQVAAYQAELMRNLAASDGSGSSSSSSS